jgi:acetolactate synthase-1/3 small subunit
MSIEEDNKHSTYEITEDTTIPTKHTIAVLVDNEFGALSRVIGLFSSRGYNIESLTVSEVDHENELSRITIVTTATSAIMQQITTLLERLVPVHQVHDLTEESPHIERTLALVKVITENEESRIKAQEIADDFNARTIDSTKTSFIFELSDTSETLNTFIEKLRPHGVKEIARTGVTAIAKGTNYIET